MTLAPLPRFVKKYAQLSDIIDLSLQSFAGDVRGRAFPEPAHEYRAKADKAQKATIKAVS